MANSKKKNSSSKRPKLPFKAARPALMQSWNKIAELVALKRQLYVDYDVKRTIDRILVDELAYHIWEINALMNVKWEISRYHYAKDMSKIYLTKHAPERVEELGDGISKEFMKKVPGISKDFLKEHEDDGISAETFVVNEVNINQRVLNNIENLISAAEKRRNMLLKELDRREMARLLINERRPS